MFLRDIVPIFPHGLYGMSLEDEVLFLDFFLTGTFKEHGQSEVVLELSYGNKFFFAGNLFISWSLFGDLDFHRSVLNEVPLAVVLETLVGTGTSSLALRVRDVDGFGKGVVDSLSEVGSCSTRGDDCSFESGLGLVESSFSGSFISTGSNLASVPCSFIESDVEGASCLGGASLALEATLPKPRGRPKKNGHLMLVGESSTTRGRPKKNSRGRPSRSVVISAAGDDLLALPEGEFVSCGISSPLEMSIPTPSDVCPSGRYLTRANKS